MVTIVEMVMELIMTMPVAAENPPRNTSRDNHACPDPIGSRRTKVSAACTGWPASRPPIAIGSTKRVMRSM